MFKRIILSALFCLSIVGCEDSNVESKDGLDTQFIMPLKVGNYWKYSVKNYHTTSKEYKLTDTILMNISNSIKINGIDWYCYAPENEHDFILLTNKSDGLWFCKDFNIIDSTITNSRLMWKYPTKTGDTISDYQGDDKYITYDDNRSFNLPIGNYKGIWYATPYEHSISCGQGVIPGIGLAYYTHITNINNAVTPPDTTYIINELIEYKVK